MADGLRIALPVPQPMANYFNALAGLGAKPELVAADCDPLRYDALVLPGGVDIDPALYHQPNRACEGVDPDLDALQWAVLDRFIRAGKPVFGICRGHELVNIYFGGTLIQNLDTRAHHSRDEGSDQDKIHLSKAVPVGYIGGLYGEVFATNSSHHQAVDRVGEGLRVALWSDDGVVEAMEHESLPILTVQFHPERMCFAHARPDTVDGSVVLSHFLKRCALNAVR